MFRCFCSVILTLAQGDDLLLREIRRHDDRDTFVRGFEEVKGVSLRISTGTPIARKFNDGEEEECRIDYSRVSSHRLIIIFMVQ